MVLLNMRRASGKSGISIEASLTKGGANWDSPNPAINAKLMGKREIKNKETPMTIAPSKAPKIAPIILSKP